MNYTRRNRMSAICPQEESEGDVRPSLLASNGVIKTEEASVMFLSWEISCRGLKDLKSKAHSKSHTSCSENSHTGSITLCWNTNYQWYGNNQPINSTQHQNPMTSSSWNGNNSSAASEPNCEHTCWQWVMWHRPSSWYWHLAESMFNKSQ